MALDQLPLFLDALGQLESGNNYAAVGPTHPTMGPALGRFQIMQSNWSAWAAEAGIPGADWRDPKAQDRVAAYKMGQYYRQFGSWDLVAVAWFAGPGRAAKAKAQGLDSVGQLKDSLGTSVSKYVSIVMDGMGKADPKSVKLAQVLDAGEQPTQSQATGNHIVTFDPDTGAPEVDQPVEFGDITSVMTAAFQAIANRVAGGERVDHRTLTAPINADEMTEPDPGRRPADFEPRTA